MRYHVCCGAPQFMLLHIIGDLFSFLKGKKFQLIRGKILVSCYCLNRYIIWAPDMQILSGTLNSELAGKGMWNQAQNSLGSYSLPGCWILRACEGGDENISSHLGLPRRSGMINGSVVIWKKATIITVYTGLLWDVCEEIPTGWFMHLPTFCVDEEHLQLCSRGTWTNEQRFYGME